MPAAVHIPGDARTVRPFRAKIDTAADVCAVPRHFVEELRPTVFNQRYVRLTGRLEPTYLVMIELDGHLYPAEVLARPAPYVLIGRDILNELVLIADGPNEWFELQRPTPPQRRGVRGRR
jgi:hypothetical protein